MIENLYERLVDLLGKPSSVHVELLIELSRNLADKPVIFGIGERSMEYFFKDSGICLSYDSALKIFNHVSLFIATQGVRDGEQEPYRGSLPFGIMRDDSCDEAEAKCRGITMAVKDYRTNTDLRPLVVTCHFHGADFQQPGIGERKLTMVSVDFVGSTGS